MIHFRINFRKTISATATSFSCACILFITKFILIICTIRKGEERREERTRLMKKNTKEEKIGHLTKKSQSPSVEFFLNVGSAIHGQNCLIVYIF